MWKTFGENGALILGLAISLYTIYSFTETRVKEQRQRYALLSNLRLQSEYFITLANSLSSRTEQVVALYAKRVNGETFPSPPEEMDSLPKDSELSVLWLVSRAEQILNYQINVDIEKFGSLLSKRQLEALLVFITAHRIYTQVLAAKLLDLKAFPRKKGVLVRFSSVTVLNIQDVDQKLNAFAESLGIPEIEHHAPTS